jgi:hypothetical protein
VSFFYEADFPRMVGREASVEDKSISLLLDELAANQEDFHEETMVTIPLCFFHHGEKIQAEIPCNVKRSPALLTEGAEEEEMKCCLFSACLAKDTRVVISF